jgi:hypothetical protein
MKVEIKHVKSNTPFGYVAIYIVRMHNGKIRSFGGDYKAAFRFLTPYVVEE